MGCQGLPTIMPGSNRNCTAACLQDSFSIAVHQDILPGRACTPFATCLLSRAWKHASGCWNAGALTGPTLQEQGPWQATLRAVCALEAVIETGHTEVCGRIAVAFQVSLSVCKAPIC